MIADMHCDTLYMLHKREKDKSRESLRSNTLCLDLERMKENDYLLQNFAAFVDLAETEDPFADAMELAELLHREAEKNQDLCGQVFSYEDIQKNMDQGKLSVMLSLEEGGICCGDIGELQALYEAGARMMTLCWNYENELAYPAVPEMGNGGQGRLSPRQGQAVEGRGKRGGYGLKERGIEFLEVMESIGMIPDVSHLSDDGLWDVLDHTKNPFVASHSNARAVCGHGRNLTDEMLHAMGERGCIAGLNYYPLFLHDKEDSEKASLCLAKHAVHMASKAGMECIGLGSDFDGFPVSSDVSDPSGISNLTWALHRAGFSDRETERICCRNVLRLYREVL